MSSCLVPSEGSQIEHPNSNNAVIDPIVMPTNEDIEEEDAKDDDKQPAKEGVNADQIAALNLSQDDGQPAKESDVADTTAKSSGAPKDATNGAIEADEEAPIAMQNMALPSAESEANFPAPPKDATNDAMEADEEAPVAANVGGEKSRDDLPEMVERGGKGAEMVLEDDNIEGVREVEGKRDLAAEVLEALFRTSKAGGWVYSISDCVRHNIKESYTLARVSAIFA